MSRTPQIDDVWEYGHLGPKMRVCEVTKSGTVYMMGVPHPSLPPDTICPVVTSTLDAFTRGLWLFIPTPKESPNAQ